MGYDSIGPFELIGERIEHTAGGDWWRARYWGTYGEIVICVANGAGFTSNDPAALNRALDAWLANLQKACGKVEKWRKMVLLPEQIKVVSSLNGEMQIVAAFDSAKVDTTRGETCSKVSLDEIEQLAEFLDHLRNQGAAYGPIHLKNINRDGNGSLHLNCPIFSRSEGSMEEPTLATDTAASLNDRHALTLLLMDTVSDGKAKDIDDTKEERLKQRCGLTAKDLRLRFGNVDPVYCEALANGFNSVKPSETDACVRLVKIVTAAQKQLADSKQQNQQRKMRARFQRKCVIWTLAAGLTGVTLYVGVPKAVRAYDIDQYKTALIGNNYNAIIDAARRVASHYPPAQKVLRYDAAKTDCGNLLSRLVQLNGAGWQSHNEALQKAKKSEIEQDWETALQKAQEAATEFSIELPIAEMQHDIALHLANARAACTAEEWNEVCKNADYVITLENTNVEAKDLKGRAEKALIAAARKAEKERQRVEDERMAEKARQQAADAERKVEAAKQKAEAEQKAAQIARDAEIERTRAQQVEELLKKCRMARRNGNWTETLSQATKVLDLDPQNTEAKTLQVEASDPSHPMLRIFAYVDGAAVTATVTYLTVQGSIESIPSTKKIPVSGVGTHTFDVSYTNEAGYWRAKDVKVEVDKDWVGEHGKSVRLDKWQSTETGETKTLFQRIGSVFDSGR